MATENRIGSVEMGGKPNMGIAKEPSGSEIGQFLADYAVFRGFAAESCGGKEENILHLYKLFLAGRRTPSAGGNGGYRKWGASKIDNGGQPATERQTELIRKLVGRGRVKFEGGTSLETLTRKNASEILDKVFGKRAL